MTDKIPHLDAERLRNPKRRQLLAATGAVGLTGFLSGATLSGSAQAADVSGAPQRASCWALPASLPQPPMQWW